MKLLFAFIAGLTFGIGLIISGMANPANVIGFLDLAGKWNPSLAFVMMGAIPVTFMAFRWLESRQRTALNEEVHLPGKTHINPQLIIGSLLFGVGWAIAGFCPGPALVSIGFGEIKAVLFVVAMLIGMKLFDVLHKSKQIGA